eukprot:6247397-Amphidinium_carterae.1
MARTKATRVTKERVAKTVGGTKEAKEAKERPKTKVRKDTAREPQREAEAKETRTLPDTVASVAYGVTNRRTAVELVVPGRAS